MNDESSVLQVPEWAEMFAVPSIPEEVIMFTCSETVQTIFTALVKHTLPEETVKFAKHLVLHQKVLLTQDWNEICKDDIRELQILKRRNKLKEQLKQKENEWTLKDQEYMRLAKEIKQPLQEIQKVSSILNETNKKRIFMLINAQVLKDKLNYWQSLKQTFSEINETQKKKEEKQTLEQSNKFHFLEAISNCQNFVAESREKIREQCVHSQKTGQEHGGDRSFVSTAWKYEIKNYMTEKLKCCPWHVVFEFLLSQQKQIFENIQSILDSYHSNAGVPPGAYLNLRVEKILHQELKIEPHVNSSLPKRKGNGNLPPQSEFFKSKSQIVDRMKTENSLQDIDLRIQEQINTIRNIKSQMRSHVTQVTRMRSQLQQFLKRLEVSQNKNVKSKPHLNDLHISIQNHCTAGPKEIQLFANIPMLALEKVMFPNKKRVPAYELASSYLKVFCAVDEGHVSSFPIMQDACNLAPDALLMMVWNQISYLSALHKSESLIKPFVGSSVNMNVLPDLVSETPKTMKLISKSAVDTLRSLDSTIDDIAGLLNIMSCCSLNEAVPKDLLVDGVSIEYFKDAYNKLSKNDNFECEMSMEI